MKTTPQEQLKAEVIAWYWDHPTIKQNQAILDKTGSAMFKNNKERDSSIAMFAVDNKFITRQEMYRLFWDYKSIDRENIDI